MGTLLRALAGCVVASAIVVSSAVGAPEDSVTEGVDVQNRHFVRGEKLVPPLTPAWSVRSRAFGLLAAAGRVYLRGERRVTAVSQRGGRRLWTVRLDDQTQGFGYGDGTVFVTSGERLIALDARSGSVRWRRGFGDPLGHPVASEGTVYVTGPDKGDLFAVGAADGALRWEANVPSGSETPVVDAERVYVVGGCSNAEAVARATGARQWRYDTDCSGASGSGAPSLNAGRLWSLDDDSQDGRRLQPPILDTATGTRVGRVPIQGLTFLDELVVFSGRGRLLARHSTTDRTRWRRNGDFGVAIAAGHDLYAVRKRGDLVAVAGESGRLLWRTRLSKERTPSLGPAFAGAPGLLLISYSGRTTAYRSVLRPGARQLALGPAKGEVATGANFGVFGVLGTGLRARRAPVRVLAGPWRRGRLRPFTRVRLRRDGGFTARARLFRNSRFAAIARGRRSRTITVYAVPDARFERARLAGSTINQGVRLRTPRVNLAGRRLVLYSGRRSRKGLSRLGSATLRSTGRSRTETVVSFPKPRRTKRDSIYVYCIRGQLKLSLGRPSALTRKCGRRHLPKPA